MANGYNQNNRWDPKGNFKNPRSKWAILIVVIVSLVLIGTGILLAYDTANGLGIIDSIFSVDKDGGNGIPTVTSISFDSEAIGMTANLNEVYVKMTYSDGSTRQVALSRLNPEGLDLTIEGKQNISISYGGEEWPLKVNVVSAEITIRYVTSDGGRIVGDTTQVLPAGQNCATVEAVPNEGWEFVGWSDKVMTAMRQDTAVSTDMEYRAIFARKTYRVRFKLADGTWYSVPVEYGDNVPLPSEGTYQYQKYGYEFGGWDIAPEKLENIQQDMDIYGIYNDNNADFRVYVTSESGVYKNNSGEYIGALGLKDLETSQYSHLNGSDNQTCEVSSTPLDAPINRTALLYQGYYAFGSNSQVKVVANPGAVLAKWLVLTASGSWVEIAPTTDRQDIVVLSEGLSPVSFGARVDYSTYTLSFNLNATSSDKVLQVIAVMEYEKNTISFEESSTIIGNLELNYTDTLNLLDVANCIDTSRATLEVDADGNAIEDGQTGLPALKKYGYTFAGWYKKDSNIKITDASTFSEDTIVQARWSVNQFVVKFSMGKSENLDSDTTVSIDYNSTIGTEFLETMPTRTNYTFVGWFEEDRLDVAVTASTLVLRDMTLIPVFTPKEHTLSFSVEGQMNLTEQIDSVKESVYQLVAIGGTRTTESISIIDAHGAWHEYYIYPSQTIIADAIGSYDSNVVKLGSEVSYYVNDDTAYALSLINGATVTSQEGVIASVEIAGITYYVDSNNNVEIAVGTYNDNRSLLAVGGNRYYISSNFTYQLREMASATINVESLTNLMTSFRIGDIVYHVDSTSGNVYLDEGHQSLAGFYNQSTGVITLNSSDVEYYADVDDKTIYQMSSVRAYLTRAEGVLTKVDLTNASYAIKQGVAYETIGSYADGLLQLATTQYYVDGATASVYNMTAVAMSSITSGMIIEGTTYYLKGTQLLVAVGSKQGDIYNIGNDVYFAVNWDNDSRIYMLSQQMVATLIFSEQGELVTVDMDGTPVSITNSNYTQGILTTDDGAQYYIYRGQIDNKDTSSKLIYETNNYVYTFSWASNYKLDSLTVNGVEMKDALIDVTGQKATLVLRYDVLENSSMIAIQGDIKVNIVLVVNSYQISINDNDANNGAKYNLTGHEAVQGSTSFTVNQGETVELDITAPKNMAIKSVTINGNAETITKNSTTHYVRFVNLSQQQIIEIVYETLEFSVSITDGDIEKAEQSYPYGTDVSATFTAPSGKYIEKISYNGSVVNIYDCAYVDVVNAEDFFVNGRPATAREKSLRDARITQLTFNLTAIDKNADIIVSYADLYYVVTTSVVGNATLTTSTEKKVALGGTVAIAIDYQEGYKIARYTEEKVELVDGVYIENQTTSEFIVTRFENILFDLALTYYVEIIRNNVVFNTDGMVTVSLDGNAQSFDSIAAFAVDYKQDAEFIITAPAGKYIASITAENGNYVLPHKATSYTIYLSSVDASSHVNIALLDLVAEDIGANGRLIVVDSVGGYASVVTASNRNESYQAGEKITVYLIPQQGYDINSVTIAKQGVSLENISKNNLNVLNDGINVYYTYEMTGGVGDITITPIFTKKNYNVSLSILSGTGTGSIYYGVNEATSDKRLPTEQGALTMSESFEYEGAYKVFFKSDEGSYIQDVRINGVPISFSDFEDNRKKATNGKYEMGSVTVTITKDTTIEVKFAVDEFTATIEAVGINTQEGDVWGTASVDKTEYLTHESVRITMQAATGWHISALVINGIYIDNSLFLNSQEEDLLKYNTSAKYTYENISQNTTIIVYYEKNTYVVNYYAYNQSINYYDIDTAYSSYGSVALTYNNKAIEGDVVSDGITEAGTTMHKAIYRGIKHGDSLVLTIASYARNGYIVKGIKLKLTSGSTIISLDNTSNELDGVYRYDAIDSRLTIYNVKEDVFSVEVYYTRKIAVISASFGDIADAYDANSVGFTFTHPQTENRDAIIKGSAHTYEVEYGINYRLVFTPTESYEIASCRAGNTDVAYISTSTSEGPLVYLDGSVASDREIDILYRKKTYKVSLAVNQGTDKLGTANFSGTTATELVLEYGDSIGLELLPATNRGGYISSLVVNGVSVQISSLDTSDDVSTYTIEDVREDTVVQVVFAKRTYDVGYVANDGGSVSLSFADNANAYWTGKVEWGDNVTVRIDLIESYEIDRYRLVRGQDSTYEPITSEMYGGANKLQIIIPIDNITANTTIHLEFALKVFEANVIVNNNSYGDVEIYDSNDLNNALNQNGSTTADIVCTKDLIVRVKPVAGKIISGVVFKMNTLKGTVTTLTPTAREYDNLHTDYQEYVIRNVTGDLSITVLFVEKLYTLNITLVGGEAESAFEIGGFTVRTGGGVRTLSNYSQAISNLSYDSNIEWTLNLLDGYDIEYLTINRRNYYGLISREGSTINNYNDAYPINDELINNRYNDQIVSGSGTNYNIDLVIAIGRDVLVSTITPVNVTNIESTADVLTITDRIDFIYGIPTTISASVKKGYKITEFYLTDKNGTALLDGSGEKLLDVLKLDDMEITYVDGYISSLIGEVNIDSVSKIIYTLVDNGDSRTYTKEVYFVIKFEIKSYAQQAVEYVFDAETTARDVGSTSSVSSTTGYYQYYVNDGSGKKETTTTLLGSSALVTMPVTYNMVESIVKNTSIAEMDKEGVLTKTSMPYGAIVTINTVLIETSGNYQFYGFEEYVNGSWVAVKDGENDVTIESTDRIRYVVYGERTFRVVYERVYTVAIDALPFHKSTQGTAPNINYVTYTNLSVSVSDPFSNQASYIEKIASSDLSMNTYKVQFGATIRVTGSDTFTTGTTSNSTSAVTYYNAEDKSAIANATAIDEKSTSFVVDKDYNLVAVFKNKVQIVLSYQSQGGESNESGGVVTVQNNNGSNVVKKGSEYYSYEIQSAYEYVTITIAVNQYYRFDGFYSRVATNRNTLDNLVWAKDDYDTIVSYNQIYQDSDGDLIPDEEGTYTNGNYTITRNRDTITIRIFVTESCMYRINYVKTYALDSAFITGYDRNGNAIYLQDDSGNSIIALSAGDTSIAYRTFDGEMRYDYNSRISISHGFDDYTLLTNQPADWAYNYNAYYMLSGNSYVRVDSAVGFEQGKYYTHDYQFVGWYLGYQDGAQVKSANLFNLGAGTYYDKYRQEYEVALNDSLSNVTDINDKNRLTLTAEYLPIYNVGIVNGFNYMDIVDAEGNPQKVDFYHATSETSLTAVMYESTDYVGKTTTKNDSLSIINEIRTNTYTESPAEYDTMTSLRLLTHVLDVNGGFSKATNSIVLNTVLLESYRFICWEISLDGVNYETLELPANPDVDNSNATSSNNEKRFIFDLVYYVQLKGITGRQLFFRPRLEKLNNVVISKVVYYEKMGEMSTSSAALRDTNVYIGTPGQTTVEAVYNSPITINATSTENYRFIGWYDKTGKAVNSSDSLEIERNKELKIVLDKSGASNHGKEDYYTDYTFEYEARFIRTVEISFSVVNASANNDAEFAKCAPFIRGVGAQDGVYYGADKDGMVELRNTVDTTADIATSSQHTVTLVKDAGTYAVLKLTTESNEDNFDNTSMFRSGFATGGSCYYNDVDEYYTLFFNYDRNITVQYVTYGEITLSNALANTKITLGQEIGSVYQEGIKIADANGIDLSLIGVDADTCELVDPAGKYIIRVKDGGELEITTTDVCNIVLPYIKKTDYKNTEMKIVLSQMSSGYILKDFELQFSYHNHQPTDKTIDLQQGDYMPFKSGMGTSSSPYVISEPIHLAAIEAIYTTSSSLGDTAQEPVTINGLTYVTYVTNPNLYSIKGVYFEMDTSYPASERYMELGNWQALCRLGNGFDAIFNGGGWEIGHIVSNPDSDYYGIFGKANGATFTEVDFMGGNDINATGNYVAILVGYAYNTAFYDINVKADNEAFLGGQNQLGTIKTSKEYVGVLAGKMENCTVENVYLRLATVVGLGERVPDLLESGEPKRDEFGEILYKVVGGSYVGGLVGYAVNTNIGSETSTITLHDVTVQGGSYLGGVAGMFEAIDGVNYTITNVAFRGNSSAFGTVENVENKVAGSYNVGGIAGYMSQNTTLSKIEMTTSGVKFFVYGQYRKITETGVRNKTEEYIDNSAIGGLVGTSYGVINNIQFMQGVITMYGSIAGGFVGVNHGTLKNAQIGVAARVLFNLQYGGYYGGMVGFNRGMVNYVRIGSYGTFSGLNSSVAQMINRDTSIDDGANVMFFADGVSDVSGETYDDRNGIVHDEWGFLAMGGAIGANSGKLYNSVTYGKVVAYKRISAGVSANDALGGLVGMNFNSAIDNEDKEQIQILSSGTSFGIVVNYTVLATNNRDYITLSSAIGGLVGHHGEGYMTGTYSYHSCVSNFYNIGYQPGESSGLVSLYGVTGGIGSSLVNFGFGTFESSWAYYNTTTYNADGYMFNVQLGVEATFDVATTNCALAYNSGTGGGPETSWGQGSIAGANSSTLVGKNTACVYHVAGKAFSSFANLVANCNEGKGMAIPNSTLFDSGAKAYARNLDGSQGALLPYQYNYSPSRANEWMLG